MTLLRQHVPIFIVGNDEKDTNTINSYLSASANHSFQIHNTVFSEFDWISEVVNPAVIICLIPVITDKYLSLIVHLAQNFNHSYLVIISESSNPLSEAKLYESGCNCLINKNIFNQAILEKILRFPIEKWLLQKCNTDLRFKNRSLESIMNSSPMPIWLVSKEYKLIIANGVFYKEAARVKGMNIKTGDSVLPEYLPLELRQKWEKYFERALKGDSFNIQNHVQLPTGEDAHMELTFSPAYDGKGNVMGISCFSHDITESKRYEKNLIESEFRYRSLIEHASDAIFITDENANYIDVNTCACHLLGYSREELLSMNGKELLHEENIFSSRMESINSKLPAIAEIKLKRKDGSCVVVESNAKKLADGRIIGIVRDITQRKIYERAEEESQQRFRAIFNGTNDAILLVDDSGKYVKVNPAACKLLGYSREELLNKTISDIMHAHFPTLWQEFMDESSHEGTVEILRKDGKIITCHYNATANILPGLHLSILVDVTKSKKAEALLRKSEARLAEAERLGQYGNWEFDAVSGELTWSDELYRIFGVDKKNFPISFHTQMDFIDSNDRFRIFKIIKEADLRGSSFDCEYTAYTSTGEKKIIHALGYAEVNPEGKTIRLFGTAQNITSRKRYEEALKESELKYRLLFADNPMSMMVLCSQTKRFLDVNEAAVQHYGYSKEEFLIMTALDIRPEEEKERFNKILFLEKEKQEGIWKHIKKDGSLINVHILFHNIIFDKKDARLVLINDVTEQLKAEEEKKNYYQQLHELTAHLVKIREDERTRISREIHDEIGQQLTCLKMDASWINKKLGTIHEDVKDKIYDMEILIDDTVNTIRRISSDLRPGILDDLGLVAALEWQGQEFERRTGIKLLFDCELEEVSLDKDVSTNVFRVFQEALTNVVKHANASIVETCFEEMEKCIILRVKDNGQGFNLSERPTKNSLGLVGMRERALLFGGLLAIESQLGIGTTITLKMPFTEI